MKKDLSIGTVIQFRRKMKRQVYKEFHYTWSSVPVNKNNSLSWGVIVGGKYLAQGSISLDNNLSFRVEGDKLFVLRVRQGFINKEFYVMPEDIIIPTVYDELRYLIPFYKDGVTDEYKKIMKEEVKFFPRDEKGRFAPYPSFRENKFTLKDSLEVV
jgi:hypothetical protein